MELLKGNSDRLKTGIRYLGYLIVLSLPWLYFCEIIPPLASWFGSRDAVTAAFEPVLEETWRWSIADISLGVIAFSMCLSVLILTVLQAEAAARVRQAARNILYAVIILFPVLVFLILRTFSDLVSFDDTKEIYLLLLILLVAGIFIKRDLHMAENPGEGAMANKLSVYFLKTVSFLRTLNFSLVFAVLFVIGLTDFF